mgnify:CR=1 FL=1
MAIQFTMHYFKNLYILFIVLALNIFFFSTTKVSAKSFEITDIEISKPFENNFNKKNVIDIGFKEAFFKLIQTTIKSSDYKKLKKTKLNEIKGMIDSFSIKEEKFIDQNYYVNLGVSFNKKIFFQFLEKKNVFPSQIIKEKFLFIPIIIDQNDNDLTIFSNNVIYDKWNTVNEEFHLINYLLPTEDLEDLSIIKKNYNIIENYNFKDIIRKYYIENSIIALFFKNDQEIRILSKIITKNKVVIKNDSFSKFDLQNEDKIDFLISKLKNTYEDSWKEVNQINTSIKLPIVLRVNNQNFTELIKFEKTLNELDLVNYFSIKKFDKKYLFYEIIFNGTPASFINIMGDNNYKFNTQKKIWILE